MERTIELLFDEHRPGFRGVPHLANECANEIYTTAPWLSLYYPCYLVLTRTFQERSHLARAIRVTKVPNRRVSESV